MMSLNKNNKDTKVERVQARAATAPAVDVFENANELLIVADIPGATSDAMSVNVEKGHLTIDVRRNQDAPGAWIAGEYQPTDYQRVFAMPQGIDASKIEAELSGGVLKLRLPKAESHKPRRVEVRAG